MKKDKTLNSEEEKNTEKTEEKALEKAQIKQKKQKEELIKEEIERVKGICSSLTEDESLVIMGLINQAAFLKVTLEELQEDLLFKGFTELFENGAQKMMRKRPEVEVYQKNLSLYSTIMKQLIALMPLEFKKVEQNKLSAFLAQGKMLKK